VQARTRAGLTQQQIAERLNLQQLAKKTTLWLI
jgi:transcriptional regulator with XRE-family HTH domain